MVRKDLVDAVDQSATGIGRRDANLINLANQRLIAMEGRMNKANEELAALRDKYRLGSPGGVV